MILVIVSSIFFLELILLLAMPCNMEIPNKVVVVGGVARSWSPRGSASDENVGSQHSTYVLKFMDYIYPGNSFFFPTLISC